MQSLEKAQSLVESISDPEVRDAAIMGAADKVEHYEIGAYNGAIALAKKLDLDDVANTLDKSHDEEKHAATMIESMASDGIMKKVAEALT